MDQNRLKSQRFPKMEFFLILFLLFLPRDSVGRGSSGSILFAWPKVDFVFQSPQAREVKISSGEFIPENNIVKGIRVSGNRIFLAIPRLLEGVPATLASVTFSGSSTPPQGQPVTQQFGSNSPPLMPYPNWMANSIGDCFNSVQSVQAMEIDAWNRLWIADSGRVGSFGETPRSLCPPKLIIMDLKTNQMVRRIEFPPGVVSKDNNLLSDMALSCTSSFDCTAFIGDAMDARIIVFNFASGVSWFVEHSSMSPILPPGFQPVSQGVKPTRTKRAILSSFNGKTFPEEEIPTLHLTLSPRLKGHDTLYYSPSRSAELYAIPMKLLPGESDISEMSNCDVYSMGSKYGVSKAMAMDSRGFLFYGFEGGIKFWNATTLMTNLELNVLEDSNQFLVFSSKSDLKNVEALTFDDKGFLYALSVDYNVLEGMQTGVSTRILRIFVGSKSYMYPPN